ncbi:MAG TPA: T9SS type A sorting domain-containing protein, partial [Bacteroidales bacterium]|nr:T9SS type A sorting domain-containing protein [Bacteroidales bacterium]
PANDILNIVSDSEIISYEVYDAIGRLMLNNSNVSNTESLVNVSSLKHGIYMLRLNTEKGSGTFKLIIE